MKRLGKYVAVGAILLFATGPVFAAKVAEENVMGISLRLERTFAASRDKVFGLWTDPKAVAQWFLPPDQARWTEPPTFDVCPGGHFSLRLISREEFYDLHGTFREVRSPEKLVLNWQWDKDSPLAGSPGDTEVGIELLARGARTDVVLTQFRFGNDESRGQYERGWKRCFREMDKLLAARSWKASAHHDCEGPARKEYPGYPKGRAGLQRRYRIRLEKADRVREGSSRNPLITERCQAELWQ